MRRRTRVAASGRKALTRTKRTGAAILLAISVLTGGCSRPASDPLAMGFSSPPPPARPYVWWHWMNGNVSAAGVEADLRWMKSAGIGGVQLFEGSLATPRVIDPPLLWSTPGWAGAVKRSAEVAQSLGLELAIASSPGWSATGAPFVEPADAMKKLVWSQAQIDGGKPVGMLPRPPAVAGPFQDIANAHIEAGADWYRDTVVLAFPADRTERIAPTIKSVDGARIDATTLGDGGYAASVAVPIGADNRSTIEFDFGLPTSIASFDMGLLAPSGFGAPPPPDAILAVSEDGQSYREIARLPANTAQARAISFDRITTRYARLTLVAAPGAAPPTADGVIGLPTPPPPKTFQLTEARFGALTTVNRWVEKAGFATTPDYYAVPTPAGADRDATPSTSVTDVTRHLQADGRLDWTPPPGRWTILRIGYSLTGKTNGPAPAETTGLEVDKLDGPAVERYITRYLAQYRSAVGNDLVGARGIRALLSDSIEAGNQNWTPGFLTAFRRLRGYDPVPWLPALTGVVIDSAERSDRFLWDYRRTISDLLSEAHYATLARVAKSNGMLYYAEALEDHRPQLGDDLAIRARADVPMGAFWWAEGGAIQRPTLAADIQGAASVANIYGRKLVGAESFTAFGRPWGFAPSDLKATADHAFVLGVNRVIIHTSAHQPIEGASPGFSLAPLLGQYFTRTETWAGMAHAWTDYLARNSWLLQQGRHAADIAYFVGEEAPVTALYGDKPFDALPPGYGFDFLGEEGLRTALRVDAGDLVSAGGVRYRLIALGGSSRRMSLATLTRLHALVGEGAVIAGPRPASSPSLGDDPQRWEALAQDLWPGNGQAAHRFGTGRVFLSVDDALQALNLAPDWSATGSAEFTVQHRSLDRGELWFVFNRGKQPFDGRISLRASGYVPELWDAVSGKREALAYTMKADRTEVLISLPPGGSAAIVLRDRTTKRTYVPAAVSVLSQLDLSNDWQVTFDRLATSVTMPHLRSWTELSPTVQKYYSGTAVYHREFELSAAALAKGNAVELDLGSVGSLAEVSVNGIAAGSAWTAPYTVDIRSRLRPGRNRVEIRVANLWVNRLIGDAREGAGTTKTFGPTYAADAPLRPSGLLGPVTLRVLRQSRRDSRILPAASRSQTRAAPSQTASARH